jgi:hypothetical protein
MRIVRSRYEHDWSRPVPGITIETEPVRTGYSSIESRILFNPFETKLIDAVLWVRNWWFETVICALGRFLCRYFRRHNVTCRGRRDHTVAGAGIVDPDRWHYWPHR